MSSWFGEIALKFQPTQIGGFFSARGLYGRRGRRLLKHIAFSLMTNC
jgi:hypothetical protein